MSQKAIIAKFGSLEAFFKDVVEKAANGDTEMLRFLLARVEPPLKAVSAPISIDLSDIDKPEDAVVPVLQAVGNGETPADEASQLLGAILTGTKLNVLAELESRLDALEGK